MIKKPKIKRDKTAKHWRNKCDRQIQEIGRLTYDKCLICGGTYSCLHHFWPKSTSTHLRYNMKNLINICQKCHFSHHNGDPSIHATVIKLKGEDWYEELLREKRKHLYTKAGYKYYEDMYNKLSLIKPYATINK